MIVGLAGNAGAGKNTVANLTLVPNNFLDIALADELKLRGIMEGVGTYEEFYVTKPVHIREWMQQEGTERSRDVYGEDCWCRALAGRIRMMRERWGFEDFVITDVRFRNEVTFIQQELGGIVLKLVAPERTKAMILTDAQRNHRSELEVGLIDEMVDGFLLNDPEHEDTVYWQVAWHLSEHGYGEMLDGMELYPSFITRLDMLRQLRR